MALLIADVNGRHLRGRITEGVLPCQETRSSGSRRDFHTERFAQSATCHRPRDEQAEMRKPEAGNSQNRRQASVDSEAEGALTSEVQWKKSKLEKETSF